MKNLTFLILLVFAQITFAQNTDKFLLTSRTGIAFDDPAVNYYYALNEGDKIFVTLKTKNDKEMPKVQIFNNAQYLLNVTEVAPFENKEFVIPSTASYCFSFVGPRVGGRNFELLVERQPANEAAKFFNTAMQIYKQYDTLTIQYNIDSVVGYTEPEYITQEMRVVDYTDFESVELYKKKFTLPQLGKAYAAVYKPQDTIIQGDKEMYLQSMQMYVTTALGSKGLWDAIEIGVDIGSIFLSPVAGLAAGAAFNMIGPQPGGEPVVYAIMDAVSEAEKFYTSDLTKTPIASYEQGAATGIGYNAQPLDTLAIGVMNMSAIKEVEVTITVHAVYLVKKFKTIQTNKIVVRPVVQAVLRERQEIVNKKYWGFQK